MLRLGGAAASACAAESGRLRWSLLCVGDAALAVLEGPQSESSSEVLQAWRRPEGCVLEWCEKSYCWLRCPMLLGGCDVAGGSWC